MVGLVLGYCLSIGLHAGTGVPWGYLISGTNIGFVIGAVLFERLKRITV